MWNGEQPWRQQGSFVEQIPPPAAHPGDAPLVCCSFNADWLKLAVGALLQLVQPSTWEVASDAARKAALLDATDLIFRVAAAGACEVLAFQCDPITGNPQYSVDGGATWTNLPACFKGAPGANGTNGTNGTNGITPQLRWSGCSFQVSLDSGATWVNMAGFDIPTLQGCLVGTPGNPQSVSTAVQACNIAAWLAEVLLAGSMSKAAAQLGAGASLADAGTAILAVAAALTGVGELAWLAVAAFFFTAQGIGQANLNAAAGDATLKGNLKCAIYTAIVADGHVTATNFAAVTAGINAIQGQGSLYLGNCSACGTWCYEWSFAGSGNGWSLRNVGYLPGHYVAGAPGFWQSTIDGSPSGNEEMYLDYTFAADVVLTKVQCKVFLGGAVGTGARVIRLRNAAGGIIASHALSAVAVPAGTVQTWSFAATACRGVEIAYQDGGGLEKMNVYNVNLSGNGPNPIATDNCTY